MAAGKHGREFDIILVGATGYTGSLVATHIAEHLPTDIKWAIAGRSQSKLESLAADLQNLNPSRSQPSIATTTFESSDITALVGRAKVCISVVAYASVGTAIVEGCIESKTDYIDTRGDIYEMKKWFSAYHEKAIASGTALIHFAGAFSAPQDLLTWSAVKQLATSYSMKAREAILSIKEMPANPSGGTAKSFLTRYSMPPEHVAEAAQPWFLSPVVGSEVSSPSSRWGFRNDPQLGILSTDPRSGLQDRAVVHRTWGLLDGGKLYGPNFHFTEYDGVASTLSGFSRKANLKAIDLALSFSVGKQIVKRALPSPGDGPALKDEQSARVSMELVAIADGDETKRAYSSFSYAGGPYLLTAACLAQGAASLLFTRNLEGGYEGGCLTPAFLGQELIDRLNAVGGHFETRTLPSENTS